jgi:hypothetical protein
MTYVPHLDLILTILGVVAGVYRFFTKMAENIEETKNSITNHIPSELEKQTEILTEIKYSLRRGDHEEQHSSSN